VTRGRLPQRAGSLSPNGGGTAAAELRVDIAKQNEQTSIDLLQWIGEIDPNHKSE